MSLSPNMGLPIPSPGITPGPTYAQNEVDSFSLIDSHNHAAGQGVPVPTAGILINADLPLNGNNLTAIRSLRLNPTSPTGANDLGIVFRQGAELAYKDVNGNIVVLTNNGSIAGASGTITGLTSPASAAFSSGTFFFNEDSSKPAKIVSSDLIVSEFGNATANPITIKSPAALSTAYTLTLPAGLPSVTSLVGITAAGILTTSSSATQNGNLAVTGTTSLQYAVVAGGLSVGGGVSFKTVSFSGTLASSTSVTLTSPGTDIIAAFGSATGAGAQILVGYDSTSNVYFVGRGGSGAIDLQNSSGSSITYKILMFYTA